MSQDLKVTPDGDVYAAGSTTMIGNLAGKSGSQWDITAYQASDDDLNSMTRRVWTEYAIHDADGRPICTGIQTQAIAEQIAFLGAIPDGQRAEWLIAGLRPKPTPDNLLDRLGVLGTEILVELRHIRAQRSSPSEARSSVQMEQDSKGQVKLTVKRYADSPFDDIGDDAIEEFGRLFHEIERRQLSGWANTVQGNN